MYISHANITYVVRVHILSGFNMTRYNDYIVATNIYYIALAVHVANKAIMVPVHSTFVYYIYYRVGRL